MPDEKHFPCKTQTLQGKCFFESAEFYMGDIVNPDGNDIMCLVVFSKNSPTGGQRLRSRQAVVRAEFPQAQ